MLAFFYYNKVIVYKTISLVTLNLVKGDCLDIGIRIKNIYQQYICDNTKKEIIEKTVKYVEQIGKDLSCSEKKSRALEKSLEWLKEKKISVSDTELEILIESAVNCL